MTYANEVKITILKIVKGFQENPYIFEQDRFKYDNDGSFRAFEEFKYRITYRVTKNQIRILRVRHTSRESIEY